MKTLKVKYKIKRKTFDRVFKRKTYPDNNSRLQYIPLWNTKGYFVFRKYKTPKHIKNDALNKKKIDIDSIELVDDSFTRNFTSPDLQKVISQSLSKLKPREERILRMKFGINCDDHTQEEIAQLFCVTAGRIGTIVATALWKLKRFSKILKEVA